MKMFRKFLCLVLAVLTICSVCACGGINVQKSASGIEEDVRSAVEARGVTAHLGLTIDEHELKGSRATVTNVKKITDTEYRVSGKIVMTDVYGTDWNNTFDCDVTKDGDSWSVGSFEYTNQNWTKD